MPAGGPAALLGVWCWPFTDPAFGPATQELILANNNGVLLYQEQFVYRAGSVVSIDGSFQVVQANQPTLRLDALHAVPISALLSETYCYQLPDNNHLTLSLARSSFGMIICCDPRVDGPLCVRAFQRRSCNAPG